MVRVIGRFEKLRVGEIGIQPNTLGGKVFLIKVVNVFKRNLRVINYNVEMADFYLIPSMLLIDNLLPV